MRCGKEVKLGGVGGGLGAMVKIRCIQVRNSQRLKSYIKQLALEKYQNELNLEYFCPSVRLNKKFMN